jgi:hypothetical protein
MPVYILELATADRLSQRLYVLTSLFAGKSSSYYKIVESVRANLQLKITGISMTALFAKHTLLT